MEMSSRLPLNLPALANLSRRDCWLAATIVPMLLTPLWVAFARSLPGPFGTVTGMLLLLLVSTCAATDLKLRKIFNWATYTAICWGIFLNSTTDLVGPFPSVGAVGLSSGFAGAAVCLIVMLAAFELSGGGAGDVKLAVALGIFLGPDQGLMVIAYTYMVAAVWILVSFAWKKGPWALVVAFARKLGAFFCPAYVAAPDREQLNLLCTPLPMAGFFATGTLLVMLESTLR